MHQIVWKLSLAVSALLGFSFLGAQTSHANEAILNQIQEYSGDAGAIALDNPGSDGMSQLNSVSQLTDVKPTDWAYQALQSLVERYGCIVGYPDKTYRGDRALSRYEFAAGLNACMDRISELIAFSTADLVKKEDLVALQKMQEEFAAEVATLRGRVDALEVRTATLEQQQFSTTTKLSGSAIFAINDAFVDGLDNETIFQYRFRMLLSTSFTGRDKLLTALYAGNAQGDGFDTGGFKLPGLRVTDPTGTISEVISTQEGGLTSTTAASGGGKVLALAAGYSFPVGDRLVANVGAGRLPYYFYAPVINGLYTSDEGTGVIGSFGRVDPLYLLIGGGAGMVLNYKLTDSLTLTGGYLADGGTANNPAPKGGLFDGGYGVLGQLTWSPSKQFSLAVAYAHDYARGGTFGFNNGGLSSTGTAITNTLAGQDLLSGERFGIPQSAVVTNGYSAQFSWRPSSSFVLSGWFGTYYPRLIGRGDGNILTYALTIGFPDLGKKGNLLGFVVGAEPYLTRMGGNPLPFETDIPLHIEAFYRHQITDNISITPGFIWLTAPNQDNSNPDAVIATLRTTFSF